MEIKFIPIEYDSFDFEGRDYVRIFGKTAEGKKACVIDSCDAFFWAVLKHGTSEKRIEEIRRKIEKIEVENNSRQTRVLKTELHDKKFLGRDVKAIKIFITNYKDGHAVADKIDFEEVEKRRGYDVNFITHYIIEKKIKPLYWYNVSGEVLNNSHDFGFMDAVLEVDICLKVEKIKEIEEKEFKPKAIAFDIETDEFEIGKGHILMISLVSNGLKKVLTWKKKSDLSYVECLKDEAEMIERFVEIIKKEQPDVLVGYYSDGFDLPYLRARAEKNGIKLNLGLDGSQPNFARGRIPSGRIKGIVHVDLFRFISTAYSQYMQSETLSLNDVAEEFLGESKDDFKIKKSEHIKEHEWKDYFAYNLQDSNLTFRLFEKVWPDFLEFSKIIQEPLFEISRDSMSQNVENYLLHNLNRFDEIPEKRPLHDEILARRTREKYEGAFVFQPVPKLYENLASFDFTSMYSSVIVTYNLSLSTLLAKKEKDSFEIDSEKKKLYFTKKPGFFSSMLAEIIEKRKEHKKEMKKNETLFLKARSNAYKLLANASYGYLGFFGARYYCLEAAASTAAMARTFIKEMIEKTNKEGFSVIYADTDGFSFLLNKKTREETLDFLGKLNKQLPGIMELELEDFYKRGLWVTKRAGDFGAKKKYALLDYKGKIKIRGFETVRRDWCDLAREMQNKVLELILTEGNAESALVYSKKIIDSIKKRKIEREKLIIKTQLKKPVEEYSSITPHVTIARKMISKGIPVDAGTLIEYYIAEGKNKTKEGKSKELVRERAQMPDEKGEYDINYYLDHQVIPAIENIFAVFGINIEEITSGKKQMNLSEFNKV